MKLSALCIYMTIILVISHISCQNQGVESGEFDPSKPLLGEWIGEKVYFVKNGDTVNVLENTEWFVVMKDSMKYSYLGNKKDYSLVPYSLNEDSLNINGLAFEILELNRVKLVMKGIVNERAYQISTNKRVNP